MNTPLNPIEWTTLVLLGLALSTHDASAKHHSQTAPLLCQNTDRLEPCEDAQKLVVQKMKQAEKPKTSRGSMDFKARSANDR